MYITFRTGKKINLIKAVRTTHGIGLKEAKDLVELGCSSSDPDELAFLGRAIQRWSDELGGDLEVKFQQGSGGVALFHVIAAGSPGPVTAAIADSALRSDLDSLKMSHQRMIEALERQVQALGNRVQALEDAPPKIIERVRATEEAAW